MLLQRLNRFDNCLEKLSVYVSDDADFSPPSLDRWVCSEVARAASGQATAAPIERLTKFRRLRRSRGMRFRPHCRVAPLRGHSSAAASCQELGLPTPDRRWNCFYDILRIVPLRFTTPPPALSCPRVVAELLSAIVRPIENGSP